jgi:hypothetical protein
MGAVGSSSASCSFLGGSSTTTQKIIFLTTLNQGFLKKNCDVAEGFRAQLIIQAYN